MTVPSEEDRVEWEEVEEAARCLLHVWTFGMDQDWLRDAWSRVEREGLTTYDGTGLSRAAAIMNLFALGHLYWDFATSAFGEDTDIVVDIQEAVAACGLSHFYIGQLVGDSEYFDRRDLTPSIGHACYSLVSRRRPAMVRALLNTYESEYELQQSFWRSAFIDRDPEELDDEIVMGTSSWSYEIDGLFRWAMVGYPIVNVPTQ